MVLDVRKVDVQMAVGGDQMFYFTRLAHAFKHLEGGRIVSTMQPLQSVGGESIQCHPMCTKL